MNRQPIYDWMGNEIKAGMTIYYVQTKIMYSQFGVAFPMNEEHCEIILFDKQPDEECWELGTGYEVFDNGGVLYVTKQFGEYSISSPVYIFPETNTIIAIKGISDTKK
ncbi:MAG: hypothetical protein WC055_15925 [Melioribacteraceae bacterium]